jgi:DNA polymerase-1
VDGYSVVTKAEDLGKIANEVDSADAIGIDIETTAFKPHHGDIRLFQVDTGQGRYVIDLFETKTLGPVVDALKGDAVKITQNAKFEQKWLLAKHGVELWPLFDPFRASAMIHNGRNLGHNLYDLYRRELNVTSSIPSQGGSDWTGALSKTQLDYAAEDVTHLHPLRDKLKKKLAEAGLNKVAVIEFGAILGEAVIENNGFRLDAEKWKALAVANAIKEKALREKLDAMMPHPKGQLSLMGIPAGFNLNSPKQIKESFARLGIEMESTAKESLGMIAYKHPAIPLFMDYRAVSKRLSSFGPKFLEHIDPITGRIHVDFWALTGAGRYSCSKPNLQQIPRTADFRSCFACAPGRVLVVCDYGQIELRITAEITGDKMLRQIYQKGEDAHRRTASIVAGCAYDEVTKLQRQAAKPVNFGLIYGLGALRLVIYSQVSYGVTISLQEAKQFIRAYFEGYSGVRRWHNRAIRDGERTHMARTLWGRLRYLDPEKSRNEFFNTPVQGTGADGLKRALPMVYHRLKKYGGRAMMVHMVHDEIVVECDDDPEMIAGVKADLEAGMIEAIQPMLPHVPVTAEPAHGHSWAEAH